MSRGSQKQRDKGCKLRLYRLPDADDAWKPDFLENINILTENIQRPDYMPQHMKPSCPAIEPKNMYYQPRIGKAAASGWLTTISSML